MCYFNLGLACQPSRFAVDYSTRSMRSMRAPNELALTLKSKNSPMKSSRILTSVQTCLATALQSAPSPLSPPTLTPTLQTTLTSRIWNVIDLTNEGSSSDDEE